MAHDETPPPNHPQWLDGPIYWLVIIALIAGMAGLAANGQPYPQPPQPETEPQP